MFLIRKKKMSSAVKAELVAITQKLLTSIRTGDYATYSSLCAPDLTCIEPETMGQIVTGLPFHKHYFDLPAGATAPPATNTTMCDVNVRVCGAGAMGFVTYGRLGQSGVVSTFAQETRVWEKQDGVWKHVHFHKSLVAR